MHFLHQGLLLSHDYSLYQISIKLASTDGYSEDQKGSTVLKVLATNLDNLSLIPGLQKLKESADCCRLSFDLCKCAMALTYTLKTQVIALTCFL